MFDYRFDIMVTSIHEIFTEGIPNAKPSGIKLGRNGEVEMTLNAHVDLRQLNVIEFPLLNNNASDSSFKSLRHIYLSFVVKG